MGIRADRPHGGAVTLRTSGFSELTEPSPNEK
jgi:hypothetical protein